MKLMRISDDCACCGSHHLESSPAVLMPFVAKRVFGHDPISITAEWGMRDLRPGTSYMPCNSLQCMDCGFLFLDYRFTGEQMEALYSGYRDETYTQERDHFEPGYAATIARDYLQRHPYLDEVEVFLAKHLPERPSVLDWGGGDGVNTPFLGCGPVHVHDISGVAVVEGGQTIDLELARTQHYDLVACSQVLEHVPVPMELLSEISRVLSPRTMLYVEVPHEQLMREHPGSRGLAKLKHHWHEHINFFTEAGLRRLLGQAGLQLVDVLYLPIDNGVRKGEVLGMLAKRRSERSTAGSQ